MKGTITMDFLIFIAGLIILVVVAGMGFGKGVAYNVISTFSGAPDERLAMEMASVLDVIACAPTDVAVPFRLEKTYNKISYGWITDANYLVGLGSDMPIILCYNNYAGNSVIQATGTVYIKKVENQLGFEKVGLE